MAKPKVPLDKAMLPEVRDFLEDLALQADQLQTTSFSAMIVAPADQDYVLIPVAVEGFTVLGITGVTSAGTLTATLKINATPITGAALNVSNVASAASATGANVAAVGDSLVMTVSASAGPADFSYTIGYRRNLG